jgi:hypothetical protein
MLRRTCSLDGPTYQVLSLRSHAAAWTGDLLLVGQPSKLLARRSRQEEWDVAESEAACEWVERGE